MVLWQVPYFSTAAPASGSFDGHWTLTLPNGGAGWLGVEPGEDGRLSVRLLWGGGSVLPIEDVSMEGDTLVLKRTRKPQGNQGGPPPKPIVETITLERDGETLNGVFEVSPEGGRPRRSEFKGQWCPPPPARPDPDAVVYGDPVVLFDGSSLENWVLSDPGRPDGWSIRDGELVNDPRQPEDGRPLHYGNLRTVQEFEDFNLKLEVNVPEKGNSGVYLRGIYEVQINDAHGREPDSHGMGGVYSRIAPRVNAAKPAGEWQNLDLTLLDRHISVVLNGEKVIDNEPLLGCTGGALWSDPFRPGPVYLQGDHSAIRYRHIVLTPIEKP